MSQIIIYDDFLPKEEATEILNAIYTVPTGWFFHRRKEWNKEQTSIRLGTTSSGRKVYVDENMDMSYSFLYTNSHQETCTCVCCGIQKRFRNNPPKECEGMKIQDDFVSIYRPGDFLTQHTDNVSGRQWAFTYTITELWRPEWGGLLNIDRGKGKWEAYHPIFNRLILMEVKDNKANHFVSAVTPDCPINRITYSGWYVNKEN